MIARYEVYIEHVEAPAKWTNPDLVWLSRKQRTVTNWTEKELMDYANCGDHDRDQKRLGSFESEKDAYDLFMATREKCVTQRYGNHIAFDYLYVEGEEYDDAEEDFDVVNICQSFGNLYEYVAKIPEAH